MSQFIRRGTSFHVVPEGAMDLQPKLPVGNYIIKQNPMTGELSLDQVDPFKAPAKVYGGVQSKVDRILETFKQRSVSTGVMLGGEKGSGKTLMARMLSAQAAEKMGLPTILINAPWAGEQFNQFMQHIGEAVVLFDEFEKVYSGGSNKDEYGEISYNDAKNAQKEVLTLLDGTFPQKKLFVLTTNDMWSIDKHMLNRPGRLYYLLEFGGLSPEFIADYCQDRLNKREYTKQIQQVASIFHAFNFDMLQALVEEMNRYAETPQEALAMLNIKPNTSDHQQYEVELAKPNGSKVNSQTQWRGNPLMTQSVQVYTMSAKGHAEEMITFVPGDIFNISEGTYQFKNKDGWVLKLVRAKEPSFNYSNYGVFA